ncbi:MAG: hypothetical protein WC582_02450 [Patescibacteria group bacterium]
MANKIDYSKWKTISVKVVSLKLDPENIRLDIENNGQDAIINDLFINEKALDVVKSIVEDGFYPDELPVVIKHGKNYMVIEGNRRISALKAIINPDIVSYCADKIKKLVESNKFKPIQNIEVKLAPSKENAMELLAMKHTKNLRRPWKPLRQAYFYYAQIQAGKTIEELIKLYPNVDVPQFVRRWEMHKIAKSLKYPNADVEIKVHDQRDFPISTLERLYDDQNFKKFFGIEFNENGEVRISSEKKSFEESFAKVISDIVDNKLNSRIINDSKAKIKYLSTIQKPEETPGKSVITSKSFTPKKVEPPKKIGSLIPSDMTCTLSSKGVQKIFDELRAINYNKFPNATADLLRTFLECSIKAYYIDKKDEIKKTGFVYLKDALEKFIKDPNTPKRLQSVASTVRDSNDFCPQNKNFLNGVNHNPDMFAVGKEVETIWAKLESIFRHILNP